MKDKLLLVFRAVQWNYRWLRQESFTITFPCEWLGNGTKRRVECQSAFPASWVFRQFSQRIRSTHRPPLRSDLWWTLSKRRSEEGQRKEILFHFTDLSWKVPGQHSFPLLRVLIKILVSKIPPGTVSNSASSWVKVARHGSRNMICSTRAWSKVKFLSLPRNWESCETETAAHEWDKSFAHAAFNARRREENNRTDM